MASNAASSVQFRVNGTEMARGRTRKTERSQSMDPRAKPRAAGRLKGKRRDNRDEREFILGSRKRRQLLYCPSLERNLSDCQQETSQKRTSGESEGRTATK